LRKEKALPVILSVTTGRHCPFRTFGLNRRTSLSVTYLYNRGPNIRSLLPFCQVPGLCGENLRRVVGILGSPNYARLPDRIHCTSAMSHRLRFALLLLTGLSACAAGPDLDVRIHESDHGAVYVERIPDRSFHATHPITLSKETMARVLRGVIVTDNRRILGGLLASKPEPVHAFGDEEIEYLAPLLVEGLFRAASDQQVGFRIAHIGAPISSPSGGVAFCSSSVRSPGVCSSDQPLVTEGFLYVYERSLYLTLTEYRRRLGQGETIHHVDRRISDSTGLVSRTMQFFPESAKRAESPRNRRSTDATLVIDYNLLAAMPAASNMRPTAAQPLIPTKGEPTQREADLEALRKELEGIKKKLAEQEAERSRSKP
jgi:hypothetical protein